MSYLVYLIASTTTRRTYVGMTNNFTRRLRQHNGELVGGAKYTSRHDSRPWKCVVTVQGFENKVDALRFEYAWKHEPPRKCHGVTARTKKMHSLLEKARWKDYNGPLTIHYEDNTKK